jgi:hypothetical protein
LLARFAVWFVRLALVIAVIWPLNQHWQAQRQRAELAVAEQHEYEIARQRWLIDASAASWWTYCQAQWHERLALSHQPQAIAWQRGKGVHGYYYEGADRHSLRLYRCSADGVSKGPRVRHPLLQLLPLEQVEEASADEYSAWTSALAALPDAAVDSSGEVAIELLRHPVDGRPLRRSWSLGGVEHDPAAVPQVSKDGEPFALLLDELPLPLAAELKPPQLAFLQRRRWTEVPDEAIDVVAAAALPGSRIVELTIEPDRIQAQIGGQIPAFDGDPPAPFGALEFDEYGIAERDWWYPYQESGFGCAEGVEAAELKRRLGQLTDRVGAFKLWYSCSPAYSDGHTGQWHVAR